jgi:glycosyltransferase involved in cell wall biosynthesis
VAEDWDGVVVLMSGNPWLGIALADHHLARHLATRLPVLFVDPPVSRVSMRRHPQLAACLERPRLRVVQPGLAWLTVEALPGLGRPGMARATSGLLRHGVRRALRALGGRAGAIIETSPITPLLLPRAEETGAKRVFWVQDDYVGLAGLVAMSPARMRAGQNTVLARTDLAVASSPIVADALRAAGHDPALVPFGCDATAFAGVPTAARAEEVTLPHPIVGIVGQLNDRTDLGLLDAVCDRGLSLLLVGPYTGTRRPDFDRLVSRPNVQWVGPKPFADLPQYLAAFDVGVVAYADSAFNRGSFPLKTLEYLAAGLPVVATDLPSTRWLETELVTITSDPAEFAAAAEQAARATREPAGIAARQAFAREHSWEQRAAAWSALLA